MRLIVQQDQGDLHSQSQAAQMLRLDQGLLTIGRGQDCGLVLQDTKASRHHAELRRYGDQWLILDLGSTNGTFVGGTRLQPNEAHPLPPGTPVQIGNTRLVLEEEPQAPLGQQMADRAFPIQKPQTRIQILPRLVVALGTLLLILGSLLPWISVGVHLPLVGSLVDHSFSGLDSNQAWLFIGAGVLGLVLLFADIMAGNRGVGLVAGLGQALVGVVIVSLAAVSLIRYYRIGTYEILGVSLMDVVTKYLGDTIRISIQFGVYLVAIGLIALIVGGLLRILAAARQSA